MTNASCKKVRQAMPYSHLRLLTLTFICFGSIQLPGSLFGADRPNIVFIYADDLGWGDIACHGNGQVKTPNLDRLSAQGIDLQQFTVS